MKQTKLLKQKTVFRGIIIFALLFLSLNLTAQINILPGDTIKENFDGIGTNATATLPSGWRIEKSTSIRVVGNYWNAATSTNARAGNSMSSNAGGDIYNFGAGDANSATDRAIGGLSSGSAAKSVNAYVALHNYGSVSVSKFIISYDVEKYRMGTNTAGFTIQMYYSTDGSTWTNAGDDFKTSFSADASNNGYSSAPGVVVNVMDKILSIPLANGNTIYLAWNYSVTSGTTTSNAQALGIDNVKIITVAPIIRTSESNPVYFNNVIPCAKNKKEISISGYNLKGNINLSLSGSDAAMFAVSPEVLMPDGNGTISNAKVTITYNSSVAGENRYARLRLYSMNAAEVNYDIYAYTNNLANPVVKDITNGQCDGFTANWETVTGAKGYIFRVKDSYSGADIQGYPVIITEPSTTSYEVTGLSSNTGYNYTIASIDSCDNNNGENSSNVIWAASPQAPNAKEVSNITCSTATANWSFVKNAAKYVITLRAVGYLELLKKDTIENPLDTTYLFTGLSKDYHYYYNISTVDRCNNQSNDSWWGYFNTITPPQPTIKSATNITCDGFKANWAKYKEAQGYTLNIYDSNKELLSSFDIENPSDSSFVVTELTPETDYYYDIVLSDSCGNVSTFSDKIKVTTADMATNPVANPATNITNNSFTANWAMVDGAVKYTLTVTDGTNPINGSPFMIYNVETLLYSVTGLQSGTTYHYSLTASSNCTTSVSSNEITLTTLNDLPTDVNNTGDKTYKVYSQNGSIIYSGIKGDNIEVYDTLGKVIFRDITKEGVNKINLSAKGIVIVKIGNKVFKLIL